MPWKNASTMDQKVEFINEFNSGLYTLSELCRAFEISRPTAYLLISRYQNLGLKGLELQPRAPYSHPNRTSQEVEDKIIQLRKAHRTWGARKIHKLLQQDFPLEMIPSTVTVNNIMNRNGLILPRRKLRRVTPQYPIFDPDQPNQIWSADYKGKFKMGNGTYCHPFTVADSKSRFLFSAKAHHREDFLSVRSTLKRIFKEYGMPQQFHTDNGSPFGSTRAIARFSRLSYWLIDLGILPVFSDPGKPQQNGRHERMHRDLKACCTRPPAFNLKAQQRKLNDFVVEYNQVRPHEALDMETPASVHSFSKRSYPDKIEPFEYQHPLTAVYVTKNGAIRWKSYYWVYMARGLAGKYIGIEELGQGIWRVFYRNLFLGYFDESKLLKEKTIRLTQDMV